MCMFTILIKTLFWMPLGSKNQEMNVKYDTEQDRPV